MTANQQINGKLAGEFLWHWVLIRVRGLWIWPYQLLLDAMKPGTGNTATTLPNDYIKARTNSQWQTVAHWLLTTWPMWLATAIPCTSMLMFTGYNGRGTGIKNKYQSTCACVQNICPLALCPHAMQPSCTSRSKINWRVLSVHPGNECQNLTVLNIYTSTRVSSYNMHMCGHVPCIDPALSLRDHLLENTC